VLIASEDHVKLADLGIAKLLSAEAVTKTTGIIGTAHYIAPEQARGDSVDGRADLYSLGCVLFEMLVGRPPFDGDAAALMYAHVHRPAPRARSIAPAVPERLDALVAGLLEKEPSARPQSAAEVQTVLGRATEEVAGRAAIANETLRSPEPTVRPHPKRSPGLKWIRPAVVAALMGLLLVALLPLLFAGDTGGPGDGTGARSIQSGSPAPSAEPPSSHEAARHVFDVVGRGFAAGEVMAEMVVEVQHKIDEAFKEIEEHQDLQRALDKIAELQMKVGDAREKGEITPARARAIDDALDQFAAALNAEV
jgi:Protein kinase domain